jgi:hypothetical protein
MLYLSNPQSGGYICGSVGESASSAPAGGWGLEGFGGTGRLAGTKLVRLTYLDEGGTSSHEPFAVVAGPIVHGDHQLVPVEEHLLLLAKKHIPEQDRRGFVFHATDIFSGSGYFKDKEKWPLPKRLEILHDLADIPSKFGLPVVMGVADKKHIAEQLDQQPYAQRVLDFVHYASAFTNATQDVELYFRTSFPLEYTLVIAEDLPKIRRMVKRVQASLQGRDPGVFPPQLLEKFFELPYTHIRNTVHFAAKAESPLLQIADTCAFIVRGAFVRHRHNPPLLERLLPAILHFQSPDRKKQVEALQKQHEEELARRRQDDGEG